MIFFRRPPGSKKPAVTAEKDFFPTISDIQEFSKSHRSIVPTCSVEYVLSEHGFIKHTTSVRKWWMYELMENLMKSNITYDLLDKACGDGYLGGRSVKGGYFGALEILHRSEAEFLTRDTIDKCLARAFVNSRFPELDLPLDEQLRISPGTEPISVEETIKLIEGLYPKARKTVKRNQDIIESLFKSPKLPNFF